MHQWQCKIYQSQWAFFCRTITFYFYYSEYIWLIILMYFTSLDWMQDFWNGAFDLGVLSLLRKYFYHWVLWSIYRVAFPQGEHYYKAQFWGFFWYSPPNRCMMLISFWTVGRWQSTPLNPKQTGTHTLWWQLLLVVRGENIGFQIKASWVPVLIGR